MNNLEKLMARGADSVAGSIILNGKHMGDMRNGDFLPNATGLAELEIDEVVPRMATPKPAKKTKADKVEKTPQEPVDVVDQDELDLDAMLGDIE